MKKLLDAWSIKQKLGAAFGMVLLILLAVSLTGLRGASQTEANALRVVEQIQPAALALMAPFKAIRHLPKRSKSSPGTRPEF
jgi:methyl-accepting chemotaxis protein